MAFSDDSGSPAAPFSGDGSGLIFELPDLISQSPSTDERIVDTQSGFLVVVKRLNDHLSLFVKRRVGTPPCSSVQLTPDESVKLGKILSSSFAAGESNEESADKNDNGQGDLSRHGKIDSNKSRKGISVAAQSLSSVHIPMGLMLRSVLRTFMVPILGIALTLFALGIGAGINGMKLFVNNKAAASTIAADPLDRDKVDKFVRRFVQEMLDFSKSSYRVSQVHAMSVMSPELMQKYWKETRFPLNDSTLAALSQGTLTQTGELKQIRTAANEVTVELTALLSNKNNSEAQTPVNLRLKLGLSENGQIMVLEQQDLSSSEK